MGGAFFVLPCSLKYGILYIVLLRLKAKKFLIIMNERNLIYLISLVQTEWSNNEV